MKSLILIMVIVLPLATTVHADNPIYAVQVLMAKEYDNALNEYRRLDDRLPVRIEKINNAFVVRVGAYSIKASAQASLKQLKLIYPDAFIIKYSINPQIVVQENGRTSRLKLAAHPPEQHQEDINTSFSSNVKTSTPRPIKRAAEGKLLEASKNISKTSEQSSTMMKSSAPEASAEEPGSSNQLDKDEDLLKAGMHSYYAGRSDIAIGLLSKYVSLNPKNQMRPAAMLVIGKSLEQLGKPKTALDMFGQILSRYADNQESLFSMVAMADIAVNHPELVYPLSRPGAEYFKDPIHAYDTVLVRNIPPSMSEHIQYYKGLALWKLKRYEKARETQSEFLKSYPSTAYRKDVQTMLKDISANLIDRYYTKGDYISVVQYFLQGWEDKLITSEDKELLLKAATSFSALGLDDNSSNVIKTLKERNPTFASFDMNKVMADIEKNRSIFPADQRSKLPSLWDKYHTGREYLRTNDLLNAEKTFSDLKTSEKDPFWSKISDYAMEEKKWAQKYQSVPRK